MEFENNTPRQEELGEKCYHFDLFGSLRPTVGGRAPFSYGAGGSSPRILPASSTGDTPCCCSCNISGKQGAEYILRNLQLGASPGLVRNCGAPNSWFRRKCTHPPVHLHGRNKIGIVYGRAFPSPPCFSCLWGGCATAIAGCLSAGGRGCGWGGVQGWPS